MNPKKEGFVKSKRNGNLPMILFLSDTVITNEDQSNFFLTNFPEVFRIYFKSIFFSKIGIEESSKYRSLFNEDILSSLIFKY